jgi:hypothetical protein
MGEDEDLKELKELAREIVFMHKVVWDEVECQFSGLSADKRERIFSLISPFINNMFAMMMNEGAMEDFAKTQDKSKKKKR